MGVMGATDTIDFSMDADDNVGTGAVGSLVVGGFKDRRDS
jgi:hypothetical protein